MSRLRIRVKPKSSHQEILDCREGVWQVALTSAPEEGKANRELLKLLGKSLDIAPSLLVLVTGDKSRNKTVEVGGLSDQEIHKRLSQVGAGPRNLKKPRLQ